MSDASLSLAKYSHPFLGATPNSKFSCLLSRKVKFPLGLIPLLPPYTRGFEIRPIHSGVFLNKDISSMEKNSNVVSSGQYFLWEAALWSGRSTELKSQETYV